MLKISKRKENFKHLLAKEIKCINSLAEEEEKIHKFLLAKNWMKLDRQLKKIEKSTAEISSIEKRRQKVYEEIREGLGKSESDRFYDILVSFEAEERKEFSDLYRQLKVSVSRVRSLTGGLDAYVHSARSTMKEVIEELYPERRGILYSNDGMVREAGENPLVLNHSY